VFGVFPGISQQAASSIYMDFTNILHYIDSAKKGKKMVAFDGVHHNSSSGNKTGKMDLATTDWVVVIAHLSLSIAVGVYVSGKGKVKVR
jgi:hypothetical protein